MAEAGAENIKQTVDYVGRCNRFTGDYASFECQHAGSPDQTLQGREQMFRGDAEQITANVLLGVFGTEGVGGGLRTSIPTTTKAGNESGVLFRGGSQNDNALTDKGTGLSFQDSLSNPNNGGPGVLRPGEKHFGVDTAKLPKGSVIRDNVPPGHVTVRGLTPDQIRQAIVDPFGDPFLGGKFPKR